MKKLILILGVIFIIENIAFSQDFHFSQYDQNPSLINPALTGSQYVMRASVIYKDQWRSVTVPYKTFGASYEMKFKASHWTKIDDHKTKAYKKAFNRLSGGLSFYSDKAGIGDMATNLGYISLASFIKTGEFSFLSLGLQAGLVQKSIDYSKLVFSNQYNANIGYDPSMPNDELFSTQNFIYGDYSAGIAWNYSLDNNSSVSNDEELSADFGIAMHHINQPKQSFQLNDEVRLHTKYVIHGKLLKGSSTVGFAPSFLVQLQGPSTEVIAGMMILNYKQADSKYTGMSQRSSIGLGAYYRYKDAIILSGIYNFGQYTIGLSYDINASALSDASSLRGGAEIMFRYNSRNPYLFQKR